MGTSTPEARPTGPVDVLVTGSAGFIGSALVARLREAGATVQGVDVRAGDEPTIRMDVRDGAHVLEVFERLRPRRVVHAAAIVDDRGDPGLFQAVNVAGTQNVLDAAAAGRVERFVHISSIAALGFDPGQGADETTPLDFDTGAPYFDTKAASEELARQAMVEGHVPTVVLRLGDVYGPGSEPWVERPLRMMRARVPVLVGGGRGLIAHTWVGHAVDAVVLALQARDADGGIFQVTDGVDDTTCAEFFSRLAAAAELKPPRVSIPYRLALALARGGEVVERATGVHMPLSRGAVRYLCRRATYSTRRARAVLGWAPTVDLDEGMERIGAWLRHRAATPA
ncbi:MAG: NAD-dependent epimerase/dehydratase family protein [Myxococcota bacterium]